MYGTIGITEDLTITIVEGRDTVQAIQASHYLYQQNKEAMEVWQCTRSEQKNVEQWRIQTTTVLETTGGR